MEARSPHHIAVLRRALAMVAAASLAGCARTTSVPATSSPTSSDPVSSVSVSSDPVSSVPTPPLVRVEGSGWSAAGLEGPVAQAGTCRMRHAADGRPLPDPRCTPGAVDAAVTQDDLASTICRRGFSASVRPPESMTEDYKRRALAAYGEALPLGAVELDHLVPLELGGASDSRNLWPEPDDHPSGAANSKDPVEWALHDLVCAAVSGGPSISLSTAQLLIASNWTTALVRAHAAAR